MDMLFSPYGVGGMPKATMAEIERTTEELLKSSSFQRMLNLENKYKMQRLRSLPPHVPSPQPLDHTKNSPPPRPERPDTLFPQEAFLMVKATRRSVIPPSLSITIPQDASNEHRRHPNEREVEQEDEEDSDFGTPTNSEPLQKQVKFLAVDDGDEGEDGMSEQSSICQSPSWEGYGQRKKEKKLETERRKREKEQADKEAKAAKKRATARLSKAPPPPVIPTRNSKPIGLITADRSMSDPWLVSRHLLQSSQSIHRPEDVERVASADDLQQTRWHRLAASKALSDRDSNARCTGGGATEGPSSSIIPHHLLCDNGFAPRQEPELRRSISEGPTSLPQHSPWALSPKHESRSPRDAFPPSASRTPRLRHMSPSGGRRNTLFQGTTNANNSQESLSATPAADTARHNGYVQHQRAQAAEWAMAGLADEQVSENVSQHCPPSSSSSGQTQHARRPSLSQEAKSAAMKLVGIKQPSSAKGEAAHTDYLTFKAIPYSSSDIDASVSAGSMNGHSGNSTALERPPTSQSSVSSNDQSVARSAPGNHGKKGRSLKGAAKAALSVPKGQQKPTNSPKPPISVPPYLRLRARLSSRTSVRVENKTPHVAVEAGLEITPNSTVAPSVTEQAKPTDMMPQGSEGSSSSSAYDDGSPLPSPTTTPDTSRPQSAKDIPLLTSKPDETTDPETAGLQDDQQTLRQSLDSDKSSTPRISDAETRESFETGREDRWSRTALPIDIDGDAQSFKTTVSNFDSVDGAEQMPSNSPSSPHAKAATQEPLSPVSKTSLHTGDGGPPISIPPRSRKRSQSSPGRPPIAPPSPAEQRYGDVRTPQSMDFSGGHGEPAQTVKSANFRVSGNFTRPFEQAGGKKSPPKPTRPLESGPAAEFQARKNEDDGQATPRSPQRDWTSESTSTAGSAVPSARSTSPHTLTTDSQIPSNPYFVDFPEPLKCHGTFSEIPTSAGPPSPMSLPSPLHQPPPKPSAQPRANSAPLPSLAASTATSRASTPSARSAGGATMPVSILKHPKIQQTPTPTPDPTPSSSSSSVSSPRPVLSALPKHMQLATGTRPPPGGGSGTAAAPIAKMLVECCSCRFFHDMPSKLYECMAKPDAVVEDRLLGISAAITTMVKCPWCQHNMSRGCCAGYAALVYLREKLH